MDYSEGIDPAPRFRVNVMMQGHADHGIKVSLWAGHAAVVLRAGGGCTLPRVASVPMLCAYWIRLRAHE